MSNFNLDDYVPVNTRIEKFWATYPNGSIDTEIVKWEEGVVVMKASIYKDKKDEIPDAVGHAYEKEGSTFVNKTSALENCETSAVGRALGILGFEISKSIASREEVANAVHQQNTTDDVELKKALVKKHKGDKAAAKKEYEEIKAKKEEELDKEIEDYLVQTFDAEEVTK